MTVLASPEQLERATRAATVVRQQRARLRKEVRSLPKAEGVALVADLIVECPGCVGTMRVDELLLWPDGFGPSKALRLGRWLAVRVGASECRCVGDLSVRQREVACRLLRRYHGR